MLPINDREAVLSSGMRKTYRIIRGTNFVNAATPRPQSTDRRIFYSDMPIVSHYFPDFNTKRKKYRDVLKMMRLVHLFPIMIFSALELSLLLSYALYAIYIIKSFIFCFFSPMHVSYFTKILKCLENILRA